MPARKRQSSSEAIVQGENSPSQQHHRRKQSRGRRGADEEEYGEEEDDGEEEAEDCEEEEDSDGSRSSDDPAKLPEWVDVSLPAIHTNVQCPICLGIIKKTRTVMGCLHRFCRECIDKSMRLGNKECPACRTHCASRRSLRDDSRYDSIIAAVYANIREYEEEELAFHEEEKTRNRQIQASIAQISRRQSEALLVRRNKSKDTPGSTTRSPRNCRAYSRRTRNTRGIEPEGYEDNEDENNHNGSKNSSSTDEQITETTQRRCKRRAGAQPSQPSPSAANSDGGGIENDLGASRECKGASSGPVRNPEMLAWGKGGARSKSVRNTRIIKLTRYLENLQENDDKYVANETKFQIEDIEIQLVKKDLSTNVLLSSLELEPSISGKHGGVLQNLEGQETLAALRDSCNTHLTLAYRLKEGAYRFGTAPETTAAQEDTIIDSSGRSSLQTPLSGPEDC